MLIIVDHARACVDNWRMIPALKKTLDYFGGSQIKLARAINAKSIQVVNNWVRRDNVPPEWCPHIEEATSGHVTCEEFHPNVKWHVLRESCRKRRPRKSTR